MRDLLETTCRIEVRGEFVGDRLIVDKAVFVRRPDGLFVKVLGLELAALDACYLRAYQRSAVFEILRAILCPDLQLPVMRSDGVDMLLPLASRSGVAIGGFDQRPVKVIFGFLKEDRRGPEQRLRLRRGVHGRRIVTGDIARLQ